MPGASVEHAKLLWAMDKSHRAILEMQQVTIIFLAFNMQVVAPLPHRCRHQSCQPRQHPCHYPCRHSATAAPLLKNKIRPKTTPLSHPWPRRCPGSLSIASVWPREGPAARILSEVVVDLSRLSATES